MVLSWFKGKKTAAADRSSFGILDLDATSYVATIRRMLDATEPAANAMSVVALANLPPILAALREYAAKHPERNLKTDLDDQIRERLATPAAADEINRRRHDWFLIALFVLRAGRLAQLDQSLSTQLAELWIRLAESARLLPALLEHNIIWSAREKEWFATSKTETEYINCVLSWIVPKWLRGNPIIVNYAATLGLVPFSDGFTHRPQYRK